MYGALDGKAVLKQILKGGILQLQSKPLPLDLRLKARVVALYQEDIQIAAPAAGFLLQRQIAGGDGDLHAEAAFEGDRLGSHRYPVRLLWQPDRLVEALLDVGRFLGVEVAGAIVQNNSLSVAGQLDGKVMELAVGREVGRE